ncbi:MAG: protein-methionine-sulfoxide reductase catalytic subunit MsrP, partial [Comamonas sp.]
MLTPRNDHGFMHPHSSEITPPPAYLGRRAWLQWLAGGAAGAALAGWAARDALAAASPGGGKFAALPGASSRIPGGMTMDKITPYADASSYNNFYEFGTGKEDPARYAEAMPLKPWSVQVEGLVNKPGTFGLEELL